MTGTGKPAGMVSDDVAAFGQKVAERLAGALGGGLVGACFVGSVAPGGYVAGESDLDIVAVCHDPVPAELRPRIAEAPVAAHGRLPSARRGGPYQGGSEAFVVEATRVDATPAVMKVVVPGMGWATNSSEEATVRRLAGGDGCAELYRCDPDRDALLMERLGRPMYELDTPGVHCVKRREGSSCRGGPRRCCSS